MFDLITEWYAPLRTPLHRVEFMRFSARPEALPRRCIVTGQTEHVQFAKVYVPNRTGGWVRLTLPFTDLALRRWKMALNLFVFSLAISLFAFCSSVYIALCGGLAGLLIFLAGIALPILTRKVLVDGNGPEVLYCKNNVVAMLLPDERAAREIQVSVDALECVMDRFVKMPVDAPKPVRRKTLLSALKRPAIPVPPGEVTLEELQRRAMAAEQKADPLKIPAPSRIVEENGPAAPIRPPAGPDSAAPSESAPPGTS